MMTGRRALVFMLALTAAWPLWSGQVRASERAVAGRLYHPAAEGWLKPVGKISDRASAPAAIRVLVRYLRLPGRPEALQRQLLAPIAFHLETSDIRLDAAALEAMPEEDRQAAFELAAEMAMEGLQGKGYELEERAKRIIWAQSYDRESRKSLFELVSELKEVHEHYRVYLTKDQRRQLQRTYALAAARAYEVVGSLTGEAGETGSRALSAQAPAAPTRGPPAAVPKIPAVVLKLLEEMDNNKQDWGERDIGALLVGFGFTRDEGSKHVQYRHPDFPQLTTSVSRQKDLPPGYARTAVKLAREVQRLRQAASALPAAGAAAPAPRPVNLKELAALLSEPPQAKPSAEEFAKPRKPVVRSRAKERASQSSRPAAPAALKPADKDRRPEARPETPAPEGPAEKTRSRSLLEWLREKLGL